MSFIHARRSAVILMAGILIAGLAPSAYGGASFIVVDVFNDELNEDADCSLREAIASANLAEPVSGCLSGSGGTDTIEIPAGTYPLTLSNDTSGEDANLTGDLDVTEGVIMRATGGRATIHGGADATPGAELACNDLGEFDVGNDDRVLHVHGGLVELDSINITGGYIDHNGENTSFAAGGGVRVEQAASLLLDATRVQRNFAAVFGESSYAVGGGIFSEGELRVFNGSRVDLNAVRTENGQGAGMAVILAFRGRTESGGSAPQGIITEQAIIRDSQINANIMCTTFGDGGGIYTDSTIAIHNSQVARNAIDGFHARGAGIHATEGFGSWIEVTRSDVTDNTAHAYGQSHGGGIWNNAHLTLERSTVDGNRVVRGFQNDARGAAVFNQGSFVGSRNTISNNDATQQGSFSARARRASPQGGSLELLTQGGGVYSEGNMDLLNSTIARNRADEGGGMYVWAFEQPSYLTHVTIARNHAEETGGGVAGVADGGSLNVMSTILGANTPNDCATQGPLVNSSDWNLDSDGSCVLNGQNDLSNEDPRLAGLADNGGPTSTMLLQPGSPAIDHVGPPIPKVQNGCPEPAIDQRGVDRPLDGDGNGGARCDIGGVEVKKPKDPKPPAERFCKGFEDDPRNQVVGTPRDDELVGTAGPDIICARGGDDTIRGLRGNDLIRAGSGDDNVRAGSGSDKVRGQLDKDTVRGGGGNDDLHGGRGIDKILGGNGNDRMQGHKGRDHLDGDAGNDHVQGEEHNDIIFGSDGDDVLLGGKQDDRLYGRFGDDILKGRQGSDDLDGGPDKDSCNEGPGRDQTVVRCEN